MSGSGKTKVSEELQKLFTEDRCTLVHADEYHRFASDMNFTDPEPTDVRALNESVLLIKKLKNGVDSEIKRYDFHSKKWQDEVFSYHSKEIVIIEGILVLCIEGLRDLIDYSVFLNLSEMVGLNRRIQRSGHAESNIRRWKTVSQQYYRDILPCAKYANLILDSENSSTEEMADRIYSMVKI